MCYRYPKNDRGMLYSFFGGCIFDCVQKLRMEKSENSDEELFLRSHESLKHLISQSVSKFQMLLNMNWIRFRQINDSFGVSFYFANQPDLWRLVGSLKGGQDIGAVWEILDPKLRKCFQDASRRYEAMYPFLKYSSRR